MKYVGISTTDPTSGVVTIAGEIYVPQLNDVVVWGTKEFMYRKDSNNTDAEPKWCELGNEDSEPSWEEE